MAAVLATIRLGWDIGHRRPVAARTAARRDPAKVGDRLTRLIRDDRLPVGLNRRHSGEEVAAARLYWIDDEFSDLTGHAAASLPPIPFTVTDAPAVQACSPGPIPSAHPGQVAGSWTGVKQP